MKIEDSIGGRLNWPVHCERNWLGNEGRVGVGQQGKKCSIAIVGRKDTLGKSAIAGKHPGLVENAANVVLPVKVGRALAFGNVKVELKTIVSAVSLTK